MMIIPIKSAAKAPREPQNHWLVTYSTYLWPQLPSNCTFYTQRLLKGSTFTLLQGFRGVDRSIFAGPG